MASRAWGRELRADTSSHRVVPEYRDDIRNPHSSQLKPNEQRIRKADELALQSLQKRKQPIHYKHILRPHTIDDLARVSVRRRVGLLAAL